MDKPIFLLSLDTEFIWGPTTIKDSNYLQNKGIEIRKIISALLNLFEKYRIQVTWAVVGHLFLDSCENKKCLTWKNMNVYGYNRDWYQDPYTDIDKNPLYYGKDIVREILSNSQNHEIGYHSFSHPLFSEISKEMAKDEIKEAKKIEKEWDISFKSFVFPCNEIAHINLLKENGYIIYRGRTAAKHNLSPNLISRKIMSGIKKIIAHPVEPRWMDGIWEIQSSMQFCDQQIPQSPLIRARSGLKKTIKTKKVFHVFLHPWNLLMYKRLEADLEKFLKYVSKKRTEGKIEIMTMGQLAENLDVKGRFLHFES